MNGCDDQDGRVDIVQYRGVPNPPHASGEQTRWRRFLEWAMPWLKQKWAMGEAVLAARVVQEVANARRMKAEASSAEEKASQDMMQTLAMARQMEQEKLAAGNLGLGSRADLEEELRTFREKLQELSWKFGTRVHIDVDGGEGFGDNETDIKRIAEDFVKALTQGPAQD